MNTTWFCGIDEAGRGPVLGPLVVAMCSIPKDQVNLLDVMNVRDSKQMSSKRRKEIVDWYEDQAQAHDWQFEIIVIETNEIDVAVYEKQLNVLETEKFAEAISKLNLQGKKDIIADACDTNPDRFTRNIVERVENYDSSDTNLVSEHKADQHHRIVSMASILAKYYRDKAIEEIQTSFDFEIGSGYPSDPKTRNALRFLIKEPFPHECLRWSWKTVQNYWTEHFNSPIPLRTKHGINQQSTLF